MLRFWVLAGALSASAVAAGAETVVLEAGERGTFREDGSWELGAEAEYAAGPLDPRFAALVPAR